MIALHKAGREREEDRGKREDVSDARESDARDEAEVRLEEQSQTFHGNKKKAHQTCLDAMIAHRAARGA